MMSTRQIVLLNVASDILSAYEDGEILLEQGESEKEVVRRLISERLEHYFRMIG